MKMIKNAVGREIPVEADGRRLIPFKGIGGHKPEGRKIGPPIPSGADYGNKVINDLDAVLAKP